MESRLDKPARLPLVPVLLALLILIGAGITPAIAGLRHAAGVRSLLDALLAEPGEAANRLVPCASDPLASVHARDLVAKALGQWQTFPLDPEQSIHLRGTAYCLLGENEAAAQLYLTTPELVYTQLQQIGMNNRLGRTDLSARQLVEADLSLPEALATFNWVG